MKTTVIPVQDPTWFVVDATGATLGRLASKVAHLLRGKHKPSFSPHQLCGDHVIILNVEKLEISPNKALKKMYYHHTGYTGHMQVRSLGKMMEKSPEKVLQLAIKGMLPQNRLRPLMLKRAHIQKGTEHPYAPQKPVSLDISTIL